MTQLDALRVLAEKVEAGTEYATMGHTRMCQKAFPSDHDKTRKGYANAPAQLACNVWNRSSLDAAKALHEAVLPGWSLNYMTQNRYPANGQKPDGTWTVGLHGVFPTRYDNVEVKLTGAARAWLLAIIRAKIQELEA